MKLLVTQTHQRSISIEVPDDATLDRISAAIEAAEDEWEYADFDWCDTVAINDDGDSANYGDEVWSE